MGIDSAVCEFRQAMERAGVLIDAEIIPDGRLHREHAEGDAPQSKNAWYVLHLDGCPVGRFGSWRLGITESWVSPKAQEMTPEELQASRERIERLKAGREQERAELEVMARERAAYIWEHAQAAPEAHLYLQAKGVKPHGLRLWKGSLVVPLLDTAGVLHSLQFISSDGAKRFLGHGRIIGCFCGIGRAEDGGRLWIAEGYATGATVHELTADPVAVAFNSGNLMPVASAVRERMPGLRLVVAADNDAWTEGNPGIAKGIEAARAVGGLVAVPWFTDVRTKPTDWNDLYRLRGEKEARARLLRTV